ncbi:AAA family ATPase, partial [Leifsonia shinshuensis]|uniref:AAA family ATPase n=1 Tax=Leifsonia shinshuensis TaxID=150026 RepID=UPI0035E73067
MRIDDEPDALPGRRDECVRLDDLLAQASSGRSAVLVLRGETGVGKTALLDYAVRRAAGFTLARATGVESEFELAYAVVQQLCAPFLDRAAGLPEPQREALGAALGSRGGEPPDRFLVGLAVLGLLAEVAETGPVLCVVDDAQWVDTASAQTLAFVARRLAAERVALVLAVRDADDTAAAESDPARDVYDGLPTLPLHGLADADAEALLDSVTAGPLDDRVRARIVAEARGNPLALLELPRDLDAAELAFGSGPRDRAALPGRIERGFARRLDGLPADTRWLLLIAAADPSGDVALLWRAAGRAGIPADASGPAEEAGLLELGAQARFRHPLMRSAVFRAATDAERRAAHRALAEAIVGEADADYRAWHRAGAAASRDEEVAAELEASAARARARGGWAAACSFLTRSMELTPDPERR